MASMAPIHQAAECDHNFSFDTDTPLSEFFGESISSDFALQETASPGQFGVSVYNQPPDLWWRNEEDLG